MRAAIDSNILLYALADVRDTAKSNIAQELLLRILSEGECLISTQALKEFTNVCIRKFGLPESKIAEHLNDLCTSTVLQVSERTVFAALHRHFQSNISFYDALIVEASLAGGAEILYTEYLQHGMKFNTMTTVNPFL